MLSNLLCTKCGIEKHVSEFHKHRKTKTGFQPHCKECRRKSELDKKDIISAKRKQYYLDNSEKIKAKVSQWKKENKELVYAGIRRYNQRKPHMAKERRLKNKDKMKEYFTKYRTENRISLLEKKRNYYYKNKDQISKNQKNSYQTRKPQIRIWSREYARKKRRTDIQYKLQAALRRRLAHAIKGNKLTPTLECLGCTLSDLRFYLEAKFYTHPITNEEMSWNNHGLGYGKWQLDHIKELRFFDLADMEQWKIASHFTNLQPLWYEDHKKKTAENFRKKTSEVSI